LKNYRKNSKTYLKTNDDKDKSKKQYNSGYMSKTIYNNYEDQY